MMKLGEKGRLEKEFFDKKYVITRPNPFTVQVKTKDFFKVVSISGDVSLAVKEDFYDKPYFFKLREGLKLSQDSMLKFFLPLPIVLKLVLTGANKEVVIDRYQKHTRMALHGPVTSGVLCTYLESNAYMDLTETEDALVPLRVINKRDAAVEISKFVLDPNYMMLWKGEKGYFTNKVYVDVISDEEFRVNYGKGTTSKAGKLEKIMGRKAEVKGIITKFAPFGISRELGL